MSVVRIRAACASDLPALRDVFRRSSLSNEGDRDLLLARPEVLELTGEGITEGRTQVAVGADDEILGFITTRPLEGCVLGIETCSSTLNGCALGSRAAWWRTY